MTRRIQATSPQRPPVDWAAEAKKMPAAHAEKGALKKATTDPYWLATNPRTLDTVLAALRAWQDNDHAAEYADTASEHGEPLSYEEIDALCEALHGGDVAIVYQAGAR